MTMTDRVHLTKSFSVLRVNYRRLLNLIFHLDSAFTERVLGLPVENYKGYVEADATQSARHIPSYSFFLMHGLAGNILSHLRPATFSLFQ